jgi:hypothetical protein
MTGRGRKSRPEDEALLAELREALAEQPPQFAVDRWKDAVRRAVEAKKRGAR